MNKNEIQVVLGGLLHDIGKVLYRYNDGRNHSISGYDFLKENGIEDKVILDQVRFHHASLFRDADIDENSPAYITYWADNVASGADRRENKNSESNEGQKYNRYVPLASVFNILNGNQENSKYRISEITDSGEINYPINEDITYSEEVYGKIVTNLKSGIKQVDLSEPYINSMLGVLEANLSFVPSSTNVTQYVDISLYDHVKMTAAIGSCIYAYLQEKCRTNFREELFGNKESYNKESFLLFSMDISGIQSFLYSVDGEGALRSLRSKSFYLEIMLEHVIDELLACTDVSRANLIYSGGGHAYLLLPNTEKVKNVIDAFEKKTRKWFLENYRTELYIAMGYAACSANSLMNVPEGSYEEIFRSVSRALSDKKASRYAAEDIISLNRKPAEASTRECRVCGRTDHLTEDNICSFCDSFRKISKGILYGDFVSIIKEEEADKTSVKLPFDRYMIFENEKELRGRIQSRENYVRSYSKNKLFTGMNVSTRLWVGDYAKGTSFKDLADSAKGIRKIGILRADVDNLGQAFVRGFSPELTSISRTATFSRKLNMFFKLHINYILKHGTFSMDGRSGEREREVTVVYSGGDDVFLVGAWNDVVEASADLSDALKRYTQGMLTISAGVGIFPFKFPVKAFARQTGLLEDASKAADGKNSITVFEAGNGENTYSWSAFEDQVIKEKLEALHAFFLGNPEKGRTTVYKLLEYIRHLDDKINLARLAYLLSRMEPDKKAPDEYKERYRTFSRKLYHWVSRDENGENRRQLITAIYLFVYLHRGESEEGNGKTNKT